MPIVNGQEMKNVGQLIETLQADPSLGRCTLRAEATWDGTFSSQVVPRPEFKGSGGQCLYAEDLLELLAKCVTYDALGFADHQGIDLARASTQVEGEIDFAGSVGLGPTAAFQAIRITLDLDADADDEALDALRETVREVSVIGRSLAAVPQTWAIADRVAA